jgi:hypothetical protein
MNPVYYVALIGKRISRCPGELYWECLLYGYWNLLISPCDGASFIDNRNLESGATGGKLTQLGCQAMVDCYLVSLCPLINLTSVAAIVDWWQVFLEKDMLDPSPESLSVIVDIQPSRVDLLKSYPSSTKSACNQLLHPTINVKIPYKLKIA